MNRLNISVSPHFHDKSTTQSIMIDVITALLPTAVMGIIIYGISALSVIATGIGFAIISEIVFNKIAKKPQTASDMSAVVTGLLLALSLPANIPLWQVAIGAIFAIVIVKGVFGGIGQNFANPAITARIFMLVAFSSMVTQAFPVTDTVSSATPLEILENGGSVDIMSLITGYRGGAIGESCTIALLVGGIYLLIRKVITWHTPVSYILTVFLFSLILTGDVMTALSYTFAGGLIIGAFFMATDYATTPYMPLGKLIFGFGAGIITVLIRFYGNYPEGVSFAILFMNILTPYIDKWTRKKPFGGDIK